MYRTGTLKIMGQNIFLYSRLNLKIVSIFGIRENF